MDRWTELFAATNNYQEAVHFTEDNPYESCKFGPGNYYANPPFKNAEFHKLFQTIERKFDPDLDQKFMVVIPKIATASWFNYTSKYEVLEEVPAGEIIFSVHRDETYNPEVLTPCPLEKCNNHSGRVFIQGTPWPVQILYRDKYTIGKPNKYDLWHAQHGHPGVEMSQQLLHQNPTASRNGEIKADVISKCQHGEHCHVCRLYKRTQSSFSTLDPSRRDALETFGKLHADLIELPLESYDGCKYFATYTCAKTGYVFGQALQRKSDVTFTTEEIMHRIKSMGYSPKTITLRTDDESVFVGGLHKEYCRKNSIILEHSPPYQKQSAGQAENTNKLVETIARTLMATTAFPTIYWPLAYRHAVLLKNIRPSSSRNWTIPYHEVTRKHFPDERLQLFGAPAAQFLHPKQRNVGKWGFTAKEGLYVGPTPDSNGNYLLNPQTGKVWEAGEIKVNNDVKSMMESTSGVYIYPGMDRDYTSGEEFAKPAPFATKDEACKIYFDKSNVVHEFTRYFNSDGEMEAAIMVTGSGLERTWMNLRDYLYQLPDEQTFASFNWDKALSGINSMKQRGLFNRNVTPLFSMGHGKKERKKVRCIICVHDGASDTPYGVVWTPKSRNHHQFQDVEEKEIEIESDQTLGLAGALNWFGLSGGAVDRHNPNDLANYVPPTSLPEAMSYPDAKEWKIAVEEQIQNFRRLGTFDTETPLPPGVKPMDSKFVFKIKTKEVNGKQVKDKYKVRMPAKGFTQEWGVNYDETFAPVTHAVTTKALMAIGLDLGWHINGMDTKSAFINSTIQFDAWVRMPEGYEYDGHKIVKLNKTLEGTKQGAHDWYQEQDAEILAYSPYITKSKVDQCLYIYRHDGVTALLSVHTDDYLCVSNDPTWMENFHKSYSKKFEAEFKPKITDFCGIHMDVENDTVTLSQSGKIKHFLENLGLRKEEARTTPIKVKAADLPKDTVRDYDVPYESLIGSCLWYSRMTRPDISYATIFHAKFTACATSQHYDSLMDTARYLLSTSDLKMVYNKSKDCGGRFQVKVISDADWAADSTDRKSYQGYVVMLNDKPITWNCSKQSVVATSSFESEYLALSEGVKAGLYISNLLGEIVEMIEPCILMVDNNAAKSFAESEGCNNRTKHVDIRLHFVRDYIAKGKFIINYVKSADNIADLLTKILSAETHMRLTGELLQKSD